jgi:hypothetical protein
VCVSLFLLAGLLACLVGRAIHVQLTGPVFLFGCDLQVKTTQPRRYLVRPNQGLIQPGMTESIQILLVEKDKTQLLTQYQNMGQAALDHIKDKFLVQSVAVTVPEAEELHGNYDKLTELWNKLSASAAPSASGVANQKLTVKHRVDENEETKPITPRANVPPGDLSKEDLIGEINALRIKYEELVSFSVNLTAERDMLNNSLEQTKRDYQREIIKQQQNQQPATLGQASPRGSASGKGNAGKKSTFSSLLSLILALLLGAKLQQKGVMQHVPVIGPKFTSGGGNVPTKSTNKKGYEKTEF